MATSKLNLPTIIGTSNADVVRDLNALANAVDDKAGFANGLATLGVDGKVPVNQLNIQVSADASTTVKGIVMLEDSVASTSVTKAATPKSIKTVNDVLTTHNADYVKHPAFATATGSANNYAVALNPAPTQYAEGFGIVVAVHVDSTAAANLNVNGIGAVPIKKANGNAVSNLKANGIYTVRYNSSTASFILQGEGASGNATASDLLSGKTASTDVGDIIGSMPNRGDFNLGMGVPVPKGYYGGGTTANGKKFATGVQNISNTNATLSITNLSFKPSYVRLDFREGTTTTRIILFDALPADSKGLIMSNPDGQSSRFSSYTFNAERSTIGFNADIYHSGFIISSPTNVTWTASE